MLLVWAVDYNKRGRSLALAYFELQPCLLSRFCLESTTQTLLSKEQLTRCPFSLDHGYQDVRLFTFTDTISKSRLEVTFDAHRMASLLGCLDSFS